MLSARSIRYLRTTSCTEDRGTLSSHTEFFGLGTKACYMAFTLRGDLMVTRGSSTYLARRLFRTAPPVAEWVVGSWRFPRNSFSISLNICNSFRHCHMPRTQPSAAQIPFSAQSNCRMPYTMSTRLLILAHAHIHPRSVQYARQIKGSDFVFHATKTALLVSTIKIL
jgi:hypothetical protein